MKSQIGLSKSSRIAQALEQEIRSGNISKGDQLASENELVRRFSACRNTVRKGLQLLAGQGYIKTLPGVGSFVTYDGATIDNSLGWTLSLSKTSDSVQTRTLNIGCGFSESVAAFLNIDSDKFLCVDRIRVVQDSGVAISLERSKTPWREDFSEILENGLVGKSLGKTLATYGLVVDSGEEWASVLTALSEEDAKAMGRTPGEPMLYLRRVTRTEEGEIAEYVESILDPSRFALHLEF